jgi:IclR family mhp operon transcriptional activator
LEVLRAVSLTGQATVNQIHALTGINRPTIVRMLETLMHAGYVVRDGNSACYRVSGKSLELSMGFELSSEVTTVARPMIEELQRKVGWPSDVAIFDTDAMIVVATSRNQGRLFYNRVPGYRAPLLATSLGRAYIAFAPPEVRERAFALVRNSPEQWNEPARKRAAGEAFVRKIRRAGYATMDPQYSLREYGGQVAAIGVPILVGGKPVGAINVVYLQDAMPRNEVLKRLLEPLQQTARRIADNLQSA